MNIKLTCAQVVAILNFYIDEKLNPVLQKSVKKHIETCEDCAKKVEEILKYRTPANIRNIQDNPELIKNLSAYIDNELDTEDNLKIKRIAVSNPNARTKLESMYKFQKLLQSAYEKTKNDYKADYSKNIISSLNEENFYITDYFKKIVVIFVCLIILIFGCFVYLFLL